MSDKERLAELIQNSVGGCARYWAEHIAEHLVANGVTVPVKCRECTFWDADRRCNGIENGLTVEYTCGNDFCSYGKRRTTDER